MVFYGKKNNETSKKEQYESIKTEILKQIGQAQQKQKEKSLANMINYCGTKLTNIFELILNTPASIQQSPQYQLLQQDQTVFFNDIYCLAREISDEKLKAISSYNYKDRLLILNLTAFALSVVSLSKPIGLSFFMKIKNMCRRTLIFYPLGGLFLAPQIYNPLFQIDKSLLK